MPDDRINAAMDGVIDNMKERTGRDLDEWVAVVLESGIGPLDQRAVRRWLRDEHGVLQNSQWAIADAAARAEGWSQPTVSEYVAMQYAGPKAHLRPIYDALEQMILDIGDNVNAEARANYIPFVHGRQFVLISPSTRTRVDLGLRFRLEPEHGRLIPVKNLGQSTHRIALESLDDVSDDLIPLILLAWEQNG